MWIAKTFLLAVSLLCQASEPVLGKYVSKIGDSRSGGGCSINLNDRLKQKTPPIYFSPKTGDIIYPRPEDDRTLLIEDGETVGILCHSTEASESHIKGVANIGDKNVLKAKCKGSKFVSTETSKQLDLKKVTCSGNGFDPLVNVDADSIFKPCSERGVDSRSDDLIGQLILVQIGWDIPGFGFKPQIDLCVDNKEYGTTWTSHFIHPGIAQKDKRPSRPSFKSDVPGKHRFFRGASSSTMEKLYSKKNQVEVFKEELNGNALADGSDIIDVSKGSSDWFAKGHLSPDAAFIYDFEQEATYFFINVDPQFQSFNNGNWKAAEAKTRDMAQKKNRKLRVIQGTSGTLKYRNSQGRKTDVDLHYKDTGIPLNKYFWKVVHDVEKNEAIAFVGINDPHWDTTGRRDRDRIFKDVTNICGDLSWVGWDYDDATSGQMLCASVEDVFTKGKLENFPDLSKKSKWPALMTTED